jgi:hypothetical protein
VSVAYGDSSASPSLGGDDVAALRATALNGGLAGLSYDFFDANLGSAGGSDRIAAAGTCPFFLILNPDTYPEPRLFSELLAAAADPRVGAVDGRQLPIEHHKDFDPVNGDTGWVSGACMLVRRLAFERVGGFAPEYLPMYCDDVDLSWRLRLDGWRTVHAPRALVFHDKRLDPDGSVTPTPSQVRMSALAGLMMARRWGRADLVPPILDYLAAHRGDPGLAAALEEWEARAAAGTLPEPLPRAEEVATFVHGNYAPSRF